VPGVLTQEKMVNAPALVEVVGASPVPRGDDVRMNEAEPHPEDALGEGASIPRPLRGPGSRSLRRTTTDDATSITGSFNIVDSGASELGLPGYPRALALPDSWMQVAGGVELTCLPIVAMG
jgi:hypothetical protein